MNLEGIANGLVKNWFVDESRWCKEHAAVDSKNQVTACHPSNLGNICKLCIYGAVAMFYPKYHEKAAIFKAIREKTNSAYIGGWNDSTTFEQVKNVVEELGI